jgi:hypothetical protein
MVAVAILAVIIVTFSIILSQTQRVVSTGQQAMRANATAAAVEQAIRKDFRRLSHNGFLFIYGQEDRMQCWLATAGPVQSMTADSTAAHVRGTGAIIGYGLCDNPAADDPNTDVLWRAGYVLSREPDDLPPEWATFHAGTKDVVQADFADIQRRSWATLLTKLVEGVVLDEYLPEERTVPPQTLEDIEDLWVVLRQDVKTFQVAWTDGTCDAGGNLEWYTPDHPMPGSQPWEDESDPYGVLWTRQNPTCDAWPLAVRIRFTLSEALFPSGVTPLEYEVILRVPRAETGYLLEPPPP